MIFLYLFFKQIVQFCAHVKVKILHVTSTVSVFNKGIVTENDRPCFSELGNGYAQSKLVAENVFFKAKDLGLPVFIHRLAYVAGCSKCGGMRINDSFFLFFRGCMELGFCPEINSFPLCFNPVDYVVESILAIAQMDIEVRIFHVFNDYELSTLCIFEELIRVKNLQCMPYKDWLDLLQSNAESNSLYSLSSEWFSRKSADETFQITSDATKKLLLTHNSFNFLMCMTHESVIGLSKVYSHFISTWKV